MRQASHFLFSMDCMLDRMPSSSAGERPPLAEIENSIYRLAQAIKKAQKRANALKNIVIPGFDETIRVITEALEEKEREEFVRLKVIKRRTGS